MKINDIKHPLVRAAVQAMTDNDRDAWMQLFRPDAVLTDDGKAHDFVRWSDTELFGRARAYHVMPKSRGYFTSIERVEDDGLKVVGQFHADRWGDFQAFCRFHISDGKFTRLDVGQL
jgi:hypothetical protein